MGRSGSASERLRVALVALVAAAAPIVACRAFVDLEGLGSGGGAGADGAAADGPLPATPDADDPDGEFHPAPIGDGSNIIDASSDVPEFDVDASNPCPSARGPAMVRIPTATGSFCIDTTEVTRTDYQLFLADNAAPSNQSAFCGWNTTLVPTITWPPAVADANKPIGGVDWCDAEAYCKWAGKRLCGRVGGGALTLSGAPTTQSEWVFVCTGAGTRLYPYGNTYDANKCNGGETVPVVGLEPVKSRPDCVVSGVYDLAGNSHEFIDSCVITGTPETDACVLTSSAYDGHPSADMACTTMGSSPRKEAHPAVTFRCCAD